MPLDSVSNDDDVTRSMETLTHANLDIDFEKLKQATLAIIQTLTPPTELQKFTSVSINFKFQGRISSRRRLSEEFLFKIPTHNHNETQPPKTLK